jgi:hypothetical protein
MNIAMKTIATAAVVAALGFVLAGCAGSGKHASTTTGMGSTSPWQVTNASLEVKSAPIGASLLKGARILSPTALGIVTSGSGGCPETPKKLIVQNRHMIRINLFTDIPPHATACPADLTTHSFVITIDPKQIDVRHRLIVRLYYPVSAKPLTRVAPGLVGRGYTADANGHYTAGQVQWAFASRGVQLRNVSPKDYSGLLAELDGRQSHAIYAYVVNGFKGALKPAIKDANATHHGNVEVLWRPGEKALVRAALSKLS